MSRASFAGRVGEWLKPADCKSAAPCGLRRFESSPVHQLREERNCNRSGRKFSLASAAEIGPRGAGREIKNRRAGEKSFGRFTKFAWVAQLVERVLGKDEVTGSIPVPGSTNLEGEVSISELEFEPRAGVTQR